MHRYWGKYTLSLSLSLQGEGGVRMNVEIGFVYTSITNKKGEWRFFVYVERFRGFYGGVEHRGGGALLQR